MSGPVFRDLQFTAPPELTNEDFQYFKSAIFQIAGITLPDGKKDLVVTRLRARLQELKLSAFSDYRKILSESSSDSDEWQNFINLLTTNKTDFFREPAHFDYLVNEFLPGFLDRTTAPLRIWCAASSTGEEPYTLAMVLSKALPKGRDFTILASDIDTKVLARAANGVYLSDRIEEIPTEYRDCVQVGREDLAKWFRIRPDLKKKITYQQHNLTDPNLPEGAPFDLVICRNVLIYFSVETSKQVTNKLHGAVADDGIFMIGHSESLRSGRSIWTSMAPSVYIKK